MKRNEYDSDINELYRNLANMEDSTRKLPHDDESDRSIMPESERRVLMSRIAGEMGISDAGRLPYAAELVRE